jgi:hypothetical protein
MYGHERIRALVATAILAALLPVAFGVEADETVKVLVLRENSVGSSAQAQPYLDRLLGVAAKINGWPAAEGKYLTRRKSAEAYVEKEKPDFGILSLGAFLAMKKSHRLTVIGQVSVVAGGGRQYFLVSKSATSLEQCKGKKLASDHIEDKRFIEAVVAAGAFRLADFQTVPTSRPVQTLKAVIRDQADCALIDDAQLSAAGSLEQGDSLRVAWKSRKLPGMPVVAFPTVAAGQAARFKRSLSGLCKGEGSEACKSVGIAELAEAPAGLYAPLEASYAR